MSSLATAPPQLDNTLGAALMGAFFAAILFGVTSVQAMSYFKAPSKDRLPMRSLIGFLWALDTLHLLLLIHGMYHYTVSSFGNYRAIAVPAWSLVSDIYVTSVNDLIIRCVFCTRIWRLSKSKVLSVLIVAVSLLVAVSGFIFAIKAMLAGTFVAIRTPGVSIFLYLSLGSGVTADALIAGCLCTLLVRSRTGFKKTDSLIQTLMMYSINTGLLTAICAALCLISYIVMPDNFVFMSFYFILSKLYLNALLATLNQRSTLREKTGGLNDVPLSAIIDSSSSTNTYTRSESKVTDAKSLGSPRFDRTVHSFAWA